MNQLDCVATDASEFGRHMSRGGWQLGLLVARNVSKEPGTGARSDLALVQGKVTANQFAELAGVSPRTVRYYYEAWMLAANRTDGPCVTPASALKPGQDDSQSISELVDEEEPEARAKALQDLWLQFYRKAKGTLDKPKPEPKPDVESEPAQEVEEQPKPVETKQDPVVEDTPAVCARNAILEIKETVEAQLNRMRKAKETYGSEAMKDSNSVLALKQLAEVIAELLKEVD